MERLRAAGWRIGGVEEFLELSPEEAAVLELKLAVARAVREARSRRALSQAAVAKRIGSSQSRVAKIELGDPSISLDLMFRAAFGLGLSWRDIRASAGRTTRDKKPRRAV